jgi:hypothetical protein
LFLIWNQIFQFHLVRQNQSFRPIDRAQPTAQAAAQSAGQPAGQIQILPLVSLKNLSLISPFLSSLVANVIKLFLL